MLLNITKNIQKNWKKYAIIAALVVIITIVLASRAKAKNREQQAAFSDALGTSGVGSGGYDPTNPPAPPSFGAFTPITDTSDAAVIAPDTSGALVKRVQRLLNTYAGFNLTEDGLYGLQTWNALVSVGAPTTFTKAQLVALENYAEANLVKGDSFEQNFARLWPF